MSRSRAEADRMVIRRARLRVSVLVGSVITLLVAVVGGIFYTVMVGAQERQVARELEHSTPSSLPERTWLFVLSGGLIDGGVLPAPAGFPLRGDLDAVRGSGSVLTRTVERNGTVYLVRTEPGADGRTVQAVLDGRYHIADRRHLLLALAIAEAGSLLAALVTGFVVGGRAVAPLASALAKQRRFVTDASHELRTPIAQAYVRIQLLARRAAAADLPRDHRQNLDRLAGSIRGLGDVVEDLLMSARLAERPDDLSGRIIDLGELAESVVARETDRADERRITLTVERPVGPLTVGGIETALRRAVGELLANAVRHTSAGGWIYVRLGRVRGGYVELTVADTGEGFDPINADRIFDRFHRGSGGPDRGFGVGLALLREIVINHGGTIQAAGQPGRGARFTLRLPETRAGRGTAPSSGDREVSSESR